MASILFAVHKGIAIQEVADLFKAMGHAVSVVIDGKAAERQLIERPPDVLVTCVMVPPSDGPALKDLVHRHHPGRTQVLLLTALGSDGTPLPSWKIPFEGQCISREFWQIVLSTQQLIDFRVQPRQIEPA